MVKKCEALVFKCAAQSLLLRDKTPLRLAVGTNDDIVFYRRKQKEVYN